MSLATSIETLRSALAPVEALRGEHSQLESWLCESFTAIDALHGELSDWQRDLTRQQALLDQREAALREGSENGAEALAAERERADDERRRWTDELREMRRLLERVSAAPLNVDAADFRGGAVASSPAATRPAAQPHRTS